VTDAANAPAGATRPAPPSDADHSAAMVAFGIGALALAIVNVSLFLNPATSLPVSYAACLVATVAAFFGDRFFATTTSLITAFNAYLLSRPAALPLAGAGVAFRTGLFTVTVGQLVAALFVLLPLIVMLLSRLGMLRSFGGRQNPAEMPAFARNPQDFLGGLALVQIAVLAWRASQELPGQQGFAFGPGTAPRLFIFLLGAISLAVLLHGLFAGGPHLERWRIRGPLFVTLGVLVFAVGIRRFGLVPTTFLLVMVSSLASPEFRWKEAAIWGAVLATFCAILFPYVLNLPMQLWPRF
jgi:putative tricarboxylic transport membrane protein